jgi:hypothetical protein
MEEWFQLMTAAVHIQPQKAPLKRQTRLRTDILMRTKTPLQIANLIL